MTTLQLDIFIAGYIVNKYIIIGYIYHSIYILNEYIIIAYIYHWIYSQ